MVKRKYFESEQKYSRYRITSTTNNNITDDIITRYEQLYAKRYFDRSGKKAHVAKKASERQQEKEGRRNYGKRQKNT